MLPRKAACYINFVRVNVSRDLYRPSIYLFMVDALCKYSCVGNRFDFASIRTNGLLIGWAAIHP